LVVVSIETIANRLAQAKDFVEVATAICGMSTQLVGVAECSVSLHAADGRPTLAVDNLSVSSPEERLRWLTGAPAASVVHVLALPLIYPRGLLGHLRCGQSTPFTPEARRDLQTLAMGASVRLTELHVQPDDDPRLAKLTARQRDVARLAGKGMSNAEIGRTLDLSHNTIKKHLKDVFETLAVASRAQLAVLMCDMGPVHDYPRGITCVDGITIMRASL
jgi:DNA-binding CsgD family transcriptional regulator